MNYLQPKFSQKLFKKLQNKISLYSSKNAKSSISPWLSPILYYLSAYGILPFFFGKVDVSGVENIPSNCPVILAPIHRSRWDGIILAVTTGKLTTGRDLHYMVTSNELKGIQGWLIRKMGGFPVNTIFPKISSFRHSVELLKEKKMLVIFPEGDIFRDGKVHTLKRGLARIALEVEKKYPQSNTKIVPIAIEYSDCLPTWGTDVNVKIGKPLNVAYYQTKVKEEAKKLTLDLQKKLEELSEKKFKSGEVLPIIY